MAGDKCVASMAASIQKINPPQLTEDIKPAEAKSTVAPLTEDIKPGESQITSTMSLTE